MRRSCFSKVLEDRRWVYLRDSKLYEVNKTFEKFKVSNLTNLDLNELILVFQFDGFKNVNNSFGIELKLFFEFDKFKYRIKYDVSEINELQNKNADNFFILYSKPLVDNYYHQRLSQEEFVEFSNRIALDLLDCTKQIYQNQDYKSISLTNSMLKDSLLRFSKKITINEVAELFRESTLTFHHKKFELTHYKDIDTLIPYRKLLAQFLFKELHLNFNFELLIYDDMPF